MKTNRCSHRIKRMLFALLCVVFVAVVGIEFLAGQCVAARLCQWTSRESETVPAPNVSISDLMVIAH